MIVSYAASLIFHHIDEFIMIFGFAAYGTAFTECIEIFSGIKRKTSKLTECSDCLSVNLCAMSLSTIFNYKKVVFVGYFFNCRKIKGLTVKMHTENSLCFIGDCFFCRLGVDFPGVFCAIHEYGSCTGISYSPCRSNISIGGNNNFITFADSQSGKGTVNSTCSVVYTLYKRST